MNHRRTRPSRHAAVLCTLAACAMLVCCSCRGGHRLTGSAPLGPPPGTMGLPPEAYTGAPPAMAGDCPPPCPVPCPTGPMPVDLCQHHGPCAPWRPDGLPCPWPQDEYLCDGGDANLPAGVTKEWQIVGLEPEDALAHYDTLDGRRLVQPSNRVCIYAPRFGAVRQVVSLVAGEQYDQWAGVHTPVKLTQYGETLPPLTAKQNQQPIGELAARPPVVLLTKQGDGALSSALKPVAFQDAFLPYENLSIIRLGLIESAEAAMLAKGTTAAVAWESRQAVQVILDLQGAAAAVQNQNAEQVYTLKGRGEPRLRLCKVASTATALPGETVDFTLRFDNVGSEVIGNVTIVDSLTTRLEYVADSAQCSRDARFSTEPNEADSLVIRCELSDPLPPGEGGVIRFRCRVR